jgi:hypothetical protein
LWSPAFTEKARTGMSLLKYIYTVLCAIGLFIIPFNSFENPLPFMGEFSKESAIVFFLPGVLFYGLYCLLNGSFKFPKKSIALAMFMLFMLWCICCTALNAYHLFDHKLKQIFGIERFIRQLGSLVISFSIFLLFYGVLSHLKSSQILGFIRKIFSFSFVIVCFYSTLEVLIIKANLAVLNPVINLFDYFPFVDVYVDVIKGRVSSVSYEPPFLAIYLITIAGWMFSYILTSTSKWRYIPGILVLLLGFFSGSRTALAVIFIQALVFIAILLKEKNVTRVVVFQSFAGIAFLMVLLFSLSAGLRATFIDRLDSLNFKKNLTDNVSNQSRLGTQVAAIEVFKDNPVIGVGFGQAAYHMKPFYPKWATRGNYEFRVFYFNRHVMEFPPNYNLYTRILAETGIIGFSIFGGFLLLILVNLKKGYFSSTHLSATKILHVVLLVSFTGFIVNWMQIDSFRIFGFWICLAVLMPRYDKELYD